MKTFSRRDAIRMAAAGVTAATLLPEAAQAALLPGALAQQGHRNPAVDRAFEELPFGSVRPDGWLRQQLELQAAGITGHLQHLYPPFTGTAWTADETNPDTEWVPWEVRAYWCDGALRCGLLLDRDALIDEASRLVQYTFKHPQRDGYLGPAFLKSPGDYHRWPHNVFFRAAMAWHDVTQDQFVVEGLQRHYLQSPYTFQGERNQTNIEAMLWTYVKTGDPKLLALAEQTWALSQQQFSLMPEMQALTEKAMLTSGPVINMHGVTYAEHSKLPALLFRATGNQHYLEVALSGQQKVFNHHMLVDGGPSSTEFLSATTARDAHETCDLADFPWTWGYLMMATANGLFGDRIERATFNAVPGAIRKDWKALQYYSSPNQFLCTAHSDHLGLLRGTSYPDIKEYRYMQRMSYRPSPGYSIVCCPANLNRILPNYIARMWVEDAAGHGLAATLYGPCRVKFKAGAMQTPVEIHEETRYPYADRIVFRIHPSRTVEFPLHLRVPGWCEAPELRLNGSSVPMPKIANGFMTWNRTWKPNDVLELRLPMAVATSDWPEDGLAFERGPLVYAYPIQQKWTVVPDAQSNTEFPAYDLVPEGSWNVALLAEATAKLPVVTEEPADAMDLNPWTTPTSSLSVAARAVRDWTLTSTVVNGEEATFTPRLPDATVLPLELEGPVQQLKLVPYGTTELRMAVFPHLKADPGEMPGGR